MGGGEFAEDDSGGDTEEVVAGRRGEEEVCGMDVVGTGDADEDDDGLSLVKKLLTATGSRLSAKGIFD